MVAEYIRRSEMRQILPTGGRPTRRPASIRLGLALMLAAGVVSAGTEQEVPEALAAGPVFFAPWFETEVLVDDNIFRRSETQDPVSDVVTTARAGVVASVPIRMSNLEIGYEGSSFFYRDTTLAGNESHAGSIVFDLNFSSHNTLHIEETYTRAVTELQTIDADSDLLVRQGIPYDYNQWAVEWLRDVRQRPAWRSRVERVDRRFRTAESLPWLDYDGWHVEYEYVQPVYRRGGIMGKYNARREDHFEASPTSPMLQVPDHVPLRREVYDDFQIGYRGAIGRNQPLSVSIGYARLSFRDVQGGDEPSDYRGLVGDFRWRLPVGGGSNTNVSLTRRPLSSSFNTYYIINELKVLFDRRFKETSRYGISLLASTNRYGDIVTTTATGFQAGAVCNDIIRSDQRQQILGFWDWFLQSRVALRMTATHNRRNSNCDLADYRSTALGMTFKVGWF